MKASLMLKKTHIPLYFQFYLFLKEQIVSGELLPGSHLPPIEELHERHGVSHGTARNALQLLEDEGLISKRQGQRTAVRERLEPHSWTPVSSRDEFLKVMARQRVRPISHGWVTPPSRVQGVFKDQDGALKDGRILHLRFLAINRTDEREKSLVDTFVPAWVAEMIPLRRLRSRTLESLSNGEQFNIIGFEQIIRPWYCDSESAKLLVLSGGVPVFRRTWIVYLQERRVLSYSEDITTLYALRRFIDLA